MSVDERATRAPQLAPGRPPQHEQRAGDSSAHRPALFGYQGVLALHRAIGNQAVSRLLQPGQAEPLTNRRGDQTHPDQVASLVQSTQTAPTIVQAKPQPAGEGTRPSPIAAPQPGGPAMALIVGDETETLQPGQMHKSEFLRELRTAVCNAAEEALRGTIWSAMGCPYIERWFGYYAEQDSQHVERAIRKYAPEAAEVRAARAYIPIVTRRVRRGIAEWVATGEVTGVPEELASALPGGGMMDVMGGIGTLVSGVVSGLGGLVAGIGSLLFKERSGGAPAGADPRAIQAQLKSGHALDGSVQTRMESAFGVNFSGVRVHTDGAAADLSEQLNARAFTVGRNVAFGADEYQPGTLIGDALIAHELAHVVQQSGATATAPLANGGAAYDSLEEDADVAAVGAVASAWGGTRGALSDIGQNAMPRLRSGLRLQGCKSEREKEIERLGGLQYSFLEEKRKKKEEEERKKAEEEAKKRGEVKPKIDVKVSLDDVLKEEVKKSGFTTHPTDAWDKLSDADKKNWENVRVPAAWNKVIASIKGTELENVMKGKTYRFDPRGALEKGYYAYQDGNALVFGMSWVHNVEADPKNAWPNLAHEMGGHFEYGQPYASEIMSAAIDKMPKAERDKWRKDAERRREFYLTYEYPETEIFAALRELRYAEPLTGPKPTYSGLHPYKNIPKRLNVMKDALQPEVARAVLKELKRRIDASPEILERDKKYFEAQVQAIFAYTP